MIQFMKETCGNLDAALRREWLETNGLGGFASSTIVGLNTRRYHGLLVAATKPPVGRVVMLSKLEETLSIESQHFDLSANRYPGVVHPQGFRYLKQFRLDPFPVFTYEIEGIEIEKIVFMIHGENSTVVQYELKKNNHPERIKNLRLELRPLIAFRDYHSTTHENSAINSALEQRSGLATITPYRGLPSLHFAHNAVELQKTGDWYRNLEYDAERERGLDFSEDLFNPCVLRFDLRLRRQASVIASTEQRDAAQVTDYQQAEITRRRDVAASLPLVSGMDHDAFAQDLADVADQYIVSRGDQKTVIAGYHWFSDWGRDTMIALPGLTLPTGKYEVARSILRTFAQHVNQGMLPNRFPDAGETPEYNTVDATLWFFEAARAYLAYTSDLDFVRNELYPVFADIISWHIRGTRYGIKVDPSGLLASGEQDHGRHGKQIRRRAGPEAVSKHGDGGELEFQSPLLEREHRLFIRRHQWRAARSVDPPQPDLRGELDPQHAVARTREEGGREGPRASAHAIWIAQSGVHRSAVPWSIHRWPLGA